jgi:hypothetical protein
MALDVAVTGRALPAAASSRGAMVGLFRCRPLHARAQGDLFLRDRYETTHFYVPWLLLLRGPTNQPPATTTGLSTEGRGRHASAERRQGAYVWGQSTNYFVFFSIHPHGTTAKQHARSPAGANLERSNEPRPQSIAEWRVDCGACMVLSGMRDARERCGRVAVCLTLFCAGWVSLET